MFENVYMFLQAWGTPTCISQIVKFGLGYTGTVMVNTGVFRKGLGGIQMESLFAFQFPAGW